MKYCDTCESYDSTNKLVEVQCDQCRVIGCNLCIREGIDERMLCITCACEGKGIEHKELRFIETHLYPPDEHPGGDDIGEGETIRGRRVY